MADYSLKQHRARLRGTQWTTEFPKKRLLKWNREQHADYSPGTGQDSLPCCQGFIPGVVSQWVREVETSEATEPACAFPSQHARGRLGALARDLQQEGGPESPTCAGPERTASCWISCCFRSVWTTSALP